MDFKTNRLEEIASALENQFYVIDDQKPLRHTHSMPILPGLSCTATRLITVGDLYGIYTENPHSLAGC